MARQRRPQIWHSDLAVPDRETHHITEIPDGHRLASVSALVACRSSRAGRALATGHRPPRITTGVIRGDADLGWAIRDADGALVFRHNRK